MQLHGDLRTLKDLSHFENELLRVPGPRRQHHGIHLLPLLLPAQLDPVAVSEKLGPVVELRRKFLHIGGTSDDSDELLVYSGEEAVGVVELAALVRPVQTGVGLQPDEEVVEHGGVRVHCAVKEPDLLVCRVDLL